MMKSFAPDFRVRAPTAHLGTIEWTPDIDIALALLCDFVADVDTGNAGFASGKNDAAGRPALFDLFSASQKVECDLAAGLMKPFVDEMKPLIETRIAGAADMLARFC